MPEIEIMNQLIKNSATVLVRQNTDLIEQNYPDSKITIKGLPSNSIIIKADAFSSPNSIFNGMKGECKRSDYVIICKTDSREWIIIIEMKKTRDGQEEIIKQLKGSLCFIEYCRKIVKEFWNQDDFLN